MIITDLFESHQTCPECGGPAFTDLILAEKKDACYHKVKASAKVWPSAYASGRLVQCRKKGAANYGNKSESVAEAQLDEKCWDGYQQQGMKNKGGRQVPNCVPTESLNEFAPGAGGDDEAGDDPYKYPKPKRYNRSADYFGQFEADHFDREDFDDATGVFKGYWGRTPIAYFKFANPARTGGDDPGMGWYYEPESNSSDNTTAAPAADNADERKQQELGMISQFLKSGNRPNPDSQIGRLMKKHGMAEDLSRRGFLRGLGAAAAAGATGSAMAQSHTVDASRAFANMRKDDPLVQHNKDIDEMARAIYDQIITQRGQPMDRRQQQMWMTIAREKASEKLAKYAPGRPSTQPQRSGFPSQGSERRVSRNIDNFESVEQSVKEDLSEEFDLIESIINQIAEQNGVDAEAVWEDLESLTEDELYVFAVTSDPLMEDWQKANKRDKTDGMSQKAVNAYRRENPGSKLKTAVTTKPSKLKRGSKASKRRKSYCSRSRGQMKMHSISCAKTPDKAICKARRRWNC